MNRKTLDNMDRIKNLANIYAAALATADGYPTGHLYALVAMSLDLPLAEHDAAVHVLKLAGLATESAHFLRWAGNDKLRERTALYVQRGSREKFSATYGESDREDEHQTAADLQRSFRPAALRYLEERSDNGEEVVA